MDLIIADGCGNNYPVSPCPPPSSTQPPPIHTADTGGGNIAEPAAIALTLALVGTLAWRSARLRRRERA